MSTTIGGSRARERTRQVQVYRRTTCTAILVARLRGSHRVDLHEFDSSYVERLLAGDSPTREHFAKYFGELLLIKLRARLRSPELVDDARQETFVRVLNALARGALQHPERLGAFVNSVCNNVLLEFGRSNSRSAPLELAGDPVSSGADAESLLVSNERKQQVARVLDSLSPKERGLLVAMLEERDKDDICRQYGVTREYLRVLMHRAVEKARKFTRAGLLSDRR